MYVEQLILNLSWLLESQTLLDNMHHLKIVCQKKLNVYVLWTVSKKKKIENRYCYLLCKLCTELLNNALSLIYFMFYFVNNYKLYNYYVMTFVLLYIQIHVLLFFLLFWFHTNIIRILIPYEL